MRTIFITSGVLLFIDQFSKILVKLNMLIGSAGQIEIFSWFKIVFIENEGMAFGMILPGEYGKIFLTLFRIIIVLYGLYYLNNFIKKKDSLPVGLFISFGLILGGAIGNIFDSIFYGVIFSESSYFETATLFPMEGGYAPLFYGSVVDMLHFPLFTLDLPSWLSFLEGPDNRFLFFAPVFNIADSGIFIGLSSLILFYRSYLK